MHGHPNPDHNLYQGSNMLSQAYIASMSSLYVNDIASYTAIGKIARQQIVLWFIMCLTIACSYHMYI